MRMSDQPPPDRVGLIGELVRIVQSVTLKHVLVAALLVAIAAPTFVLYRFMTDASLLNKFTSFYEELASDKVPCTLRIASQRGTDPVYSISTGFSIQGSDRYTVAVLLTHKPDDGQLVSYCETLQRIVDFMRRPDAPSPTFPNTDQPVIWPYQPDASP